MNPSAEVRLPKFQRVREHLRAQIRERSFPPGTRLPSQLELSRNLKVNHLTVRRALLDLVREGLIVRRRGSGTYVADQRHPPLLPGRNLRLGILWHTAVLPHALRDRMQGEITRGALAHWGLGQTAPEFSTVDDPDTTRARWTSLDRSLTVECLSEGEEGHTRHPPLELVRARGFDALLAVSIIEEAWLKELTALGKPVVLVDFLSDRFMPLADQVYWDPLPGYRAAIHRFAQQGLRRIYFVGCYLPIPAPSAQMSHQEWQAFTQDKRRVDPDSYLRLSAYRQAMHECGLHVSEEWVQFSSSDPRSAGRLLIKSLRWRPLSTAFWMSGTSSAGT